ncbi:hypothetical protein RHMOL_Rhmol01G0218200 [Rhododendron molle]|uniref:Uncharacterized protein n=1 Tax=Rhododendron molle TaxID=49168 RepID=A0ACC0Q5G1_RHOML|nr:hypothetical protein RHMOL_Rhmol01G0218200 [Rhododendron molle]
MRAARTAAQANEPDVENITWVEFEVLFEEQYFPKTSRDQLREEFERGLHDTVKKFVVAQRKGKFFVVVECARSIETLKEAPRNPKAWEPRQLCPRLLVTCFTCGKAGHFARNCPIGEGTQSKFGSVQQPRSGQSSGRQSFQGTQRQQQPYFRQTTSAQGSKVERGVSSSAPTQGFGQRGGHVKSQMTKGRAFAITSAIPPPSPPVTSQTPETSVVKGTFLLFNSFVGVLFDSGASYSFIAASIACALELEIESINPPLFVETPIKGRSLLDRICRNCELIIRDHRFTFDFIVLNMSGLTLFWAWIGYLRFTLPLIASSVGSVSVRLGVLVLSSSGSVGNR